MKISKDNNVHEVNSIYFAARKKILTIYFFVTMKIAFSKQIASQSFAFLNGNLP